MKNYMQLVDSLAPKVNEVFPWDVENTIDDYDLIIDVREPYEFAQLRLQGALNVPRGILESACDWDYEETIPALAQARTQKILIVCRSGHRSVLAAYNMQLMGFEQVDSLKTGLRGWFEFEQELVDEQGKIVDEDTAEEHFASQVKAQQLNPARKVVL